MSSKRTSVSKRPSRIPSQTATFKKDLQKAQAHCKCDSSALRRVMDDIQARRALAACHLDHPLKGAYPEQRGGKSDCRECHVCNDWLLVYRFPDDHSVHFIRTGTHSELAL